MDLAARTNQTAVVEYLLQCYREELVENEGNRCLHAVLDAADYSFGGGIVVLPVGTITVDLMLDLLAHFVFDKPGCIHDVDCSGALALHRACITASPFEVVCFLVEYNRDSVCKTDRNLSTPLHCACLAGASFRVLCFLVDKEPAVLRAPDTNLSLPIHCACLAELPLGAIQYLVEQDHAGITIYSLDSNRETPLHIACRKGSRDTIRFLAEQDTAVLRKPNRSGELPIHVACCSGCSLQTIKLLVEQDGGVATLGVCDNLKYLPLHALCASGSSAVAAVKYLAEANPDAMDALSGSGESPLDLAIKTSSSEDVIEVLSTARSNAPL